MPATTLLASALPPLVAPGAYFDPTLATPPQSPSFSAGAPQQVLSVSRQVAARADLAERYGAPGGYGVLEGLELLALTTSGVPVTAGVADLDGLAVLPPLPGDDPRVTAGNPLNIGAFVAMVDGTGAKNWIYATAAAGIIVPVGVPNSLVPPTGGSVPSCPLGMCSMTAGVGTLDYSNRVTRGIGGGWERTTGDAAAPTDTPPATLRFVNHCAGAASDLSFYWDGAAYRERLWGGNIRDPVVDKDPANKAYVDAALAGATDAKDSVRVVTAAALPAYTRSANVITATGNGALAAVDGVTLVLNDRLLLRHGAAGADNGLYYVSQVGDGSHPYTLTRTTDADTSGEVTAGLYVFATEGTAHANSGWLLVTTGAITLNTTALDFTQVAGFPAILGGAGLSKTGSTLDVNVDGTTLQIASDVVGVKAGGIDPTHLSFDPATQAELDALLISHAGTPEAAVVATPGTLCEDTTNGALFLKVTGSGNTGWQQLKSATALLPYSDSTAATVFNTVVEGTFSPSPTAFPGGSLKAGQVLKWRLWGVYGQATLPATLRARIYMGSVLLLDTGALSGFVTVTNKGWRAEVEIRVNNAGASGSVEAQGILSFATAAGAALAAHVANSAAVTGIDFTASQQLSVSVQWGTADVADTITRRLQTLEVLG